jgi:hypothetical protein
MNVTQQLIFLLSIAAMILIILLFYGNDIAESIPNDPSETTQDATSLEEETFIQVMSASYGYNCNEYLLNQRRNSRYATNSAQELVRENNILRMVSHFCNGKTECAFDANPKAFGFDPAPFCLKMVDIEYRCTLYAFPTKLRVQERNVVQLKCQ